MMNVGAQGNSAKTGRRQLQALVRRRPQRASHHLPPEDEGECDRRGDCRRDHSAFVMPPALCCELVGSSPDTQQIDSPRMAFTFWGEAATGSALEVGRSSSTQKERG